MDGIEPAEAESRQNPVHLDGYVAAARQGEFQFSCSWLIHTGMPIKRQQPWSYHRQPADNEGPCSSYLHCLLLQASSAACRVSITLIRCMCITCTCIHFKQAGLLQQLARRHLRHSHSAATVQLNTLWTQALYMVSFIWFDVPWAIRKILAQAALNNSACSSESVIWAAVHLATQFNLPN